MDILESSNNYRELESLDLARDYVNANPSGWLDPAMPMLQYTTVVHKELESFRAGGEVAPYDALVSLLRHSLLPTGSTLLDVGASSGYYSQVLLARDIYYHYTGFDFSRHYAVAARTLFGVPFIVGDATNMHMIPDRSFDIVVSGGMLMHNLDYPKAILEIQRVADKQIVFHRTPVSLNDQTRYFVKEAYGLPCLEIHFNEKEILDLMQTHGWYVVTSHAVSWDKEMEKGHVSYLLKRQRSDA
jgi:ubiquinone/menaquinone biosynthesis C-methylase UbiE